MTTVIVESSPPPNREEPDPDFFNLFAQQEGAPDGWRWYSADCIGDQKDKLIKLRGAVCTATYARGKRKGETNWSKRDKQTEREYVVSADQIDRIKDRWERQTGQCADCKGKGTKLAHWRRSGEHEYRACDRCIGSGKAPREHAPERDPANVPTNEISAGSAAVKFNDAADNSP